jgi:hypothetical protein
MAYQNNFASRIISSENISSTGTSAQSNRAPFGCKVVRIATSANVNIAISGNPTATVLHLQQTVKKLPALVQQR